MTSSEFSVAVLFQYKSRFDVEPRFVLKYYRVEGGIMVSCGATTGKKLVF